MSKQSVIIEVGKAYLESKQTISGKRIKGSGVGTGNATAKRIANQFKIAPRSVANYSKVAEVVLALDKLFEEADVVELFLSGDFKVKGSAVKLYSHIIENVKSVDSISFNNFIQKVEQTTRTNSNPFMPYDNRELFLVFEAWVNANKPKEDVPEMALYSYVSKYGKEAGEKRYHDAIEFHEAKDKLIALTYEQVMTEQKRLGRTGLLDSIVEGMVYLPEDNRLYMLFEDLRGRKAEYFNSLRAINMMM